MSLTAISLGGGVQSCALVVMATRGELDVDVAIMANVGDRAENPETLAYLTHFVPWAAAHGVEIVIRRWIDRKGRERDLYDDTMAQGRRSIDIPVYMAGGAPGRRKCTDRYKIAVVGRELRARGATATNPATVMVGISWDESHRINARHAAAWEIPTYPLVDRRLTRHDCELMFADVGLPVPPKSACWFCPFQGSKGWARRRRDDPAVFERGVAMEVRINETREVLGRDHVYLAPTLRPLDELREADPTLFGDGSFNDGSCDEGYCWT